MKLTLLLGLFMVMITLGVVVAQQTQYTPEYGWYEIIEEGVITQEWQDYFTAQNNTLTVLHNATHSYIRLDTRTEGWQTVRDEFSLAMSLLRTQQTLSFDVLSLPDSTIHAYEVQASIFTSNSPFVVRGRDGVTVFCGVTTNNQPFTITYFMQGAGQIRQNFNQEPYLTQCQEKLDQYDTYEENRCPPQSNRPSCRGVE